jgi:hypothetical protein
VSWPTAAEVDEALTLVTLGLTGAAKLSDVEQRLALSTLRRAARPRPVWPAKEAAECLGTVSANLTPARFRGLPEPAWVFPRPSVTHPGRVERLFWADEIEGLAAARRARERERSGA